MALQTSLVRRLGIEHPIIQAPMAGGATTTDLVASVSEAGGLGFLGCAYLTPEQIVAACTEVRSRTDRPFGVNLFAPLASPGPDGDPSRMLRLLEPVHADLQIPPPNEPPVEDVSFDDRLEAVLAARPSVFSFTFGSLPPETIAELKARDMFVIGTATTVEEALVLSAAGVDAVVAQGSEAGAHRGTFGTTFEAAMVGTVALVPQMVDAISIPVIASGGIMDGRGIGAALALGAQAAQLGTAFLPCDESGIPESHKQAIIDGREDQTRVTRAFSGRPARGLVNRFMDDVDREPDVILPFPRQNALTRAARGAAARLDRPEFLSLWAGQGVRLSRRGSASELVAMLAAETVAVLEAAGT